VPLFFDSTGFQQQDQQVWVHPSTGDIVGLQYFDLVPDLPATLDDLPKLRHDLTIIHGQDGCLIEAYVVNFAGVPALLRLIKNPLPGAPAGQLFSAVITVPKATCSANLQIMCPERGTTGIREAMLMAQVGPQNWFVQHPYAPGFTGKLPYHVGDDARWDPQFPEHPLTRARAWLHHALSTARIDPGFAALPPFQGTQPPPQQQQPQEQGPLGPGSNLRTVVTGIPVGGILPLWLDQQTCAYWELAEPQPVLGQLGSGKNGRSPLQDNWRRECMLFDMEGKTLLAHERFTKDDGGVVAAQVPGRLVSREEATARVNEQTMAEAFAWVGRVYEQAVERNEGVLVGPGGVELYGRPRVVLLGMAGVSRIDASPPPVGAPIWDDQRQPQDPVGPEDAQVLSSPITNGESVRAGGTLAGFAARTWNVDPLHLAVSFKELAG